jgi:plastocyanin
MRATLALIPVSAVAALALAGCGSSSTSGGASTTAPAQTAPAGVTISMGEYFYRPSQATVRVGEPVTFVNDGRIEHTVADTGPGGAIRSALIHPRPLAHGQRQTVTFHRPGLVRYLCTFHPTLMSGQITVTAR